MIRQPRLSPVLMVIIVGHGLTPQDGVLGTEREPAKSSFDSALADSRGGLWSEICAYEDESAPTKWWRCGQDYECCNIQDPACGGVNADGISYKTHRVNYRWYSRCLPSLLAYKRCSDLEAFIPKYLKRCYAEGCADGPPVRIIEAGGDCCGCAVSIAGP